MALLFLLRRWRRHGWQTLGNDNLHSFIHGNLRDTGWLVRPAVLFVCRFVFRPFIPQIQLRIIGGVRNALQIGSLGTVGAMPR